MAASLSFRGDFIHVLFFIHFLGAFPNNFIPFSTLRRRRGSTLSGFHTRFQLRLAGRLSRGTCLGSGTVGALQRLWFSYHSCGSVQPTRAGLVSGACCLSGSSAHRRLAPGKPGPSESALRRLVDGGAGLGRTLAGWFSREGFECVHFLSRCKVGSTALPGRSMLAGVFKVGLVLA